MSVNQDVKSKESFASYHMHLQYSYSITARGPNERLINQKSQLDRGVSKIKLDLASRCDWKVVKLYKLYGRR